ncbi:hypothetical protein FA95DRAFT_1606036 [Auriscalpium vulgare]|uniref:Uncharacterized protein n=1 Tax=Auriscalpium vulgare TaxID=40419 RepID=A0ACB8RUI8_9AGAM|nr:hypothetical protein FA95DRAFT_1606036 [Auriscalpium vulgare]
MAFNLDDFIVPLIPTSLPRVPALFNGITVTEPRQHAYARARALEALGAWPNATDDWCQPTFAPEVGGRVLGRFLCEAPGEECVDIVAQEINCCVRVVDAETQRCLASLASFYVDIVLKTFIQYSDDTRQREDDDDFVEKKVDPFDIAEKAALIREDNRCILTRYLDYDHRKRGADRGSDHRWTYTQACYIIPHMMTSGHLTAWSMVRAILQPSGGLDTKQVTGQRVNDLENILTLDVTAYGHFTYLDLWLTPVKGRSDTYGVEGTSIDVLEDLLLRKNPVTFTSTDPQERPLPDPLLLSLHRACVHVLHLNPLVLSDDDAECDFMDEDSG